MIIKLTEQQYKWLSEAKDIVTEDVYINDISKKRNKNIANLTYNKRNSSSPTKNFGNMKSSDMLDTGKMDQNNSDTFIVPLKGGNQLI